VYPEHGRFLSPLSAGEHAGKRPEHVESESGEGEEEEEGGLGLEVVTHGLFLFS
jgi:hypothetical protein